MRTSRNILINLLQTANEITVSCVNSGSFTYRVKALVMEPRHNTGRTIRVEALYFILDNYRAAMDLFDMTEDEIFAMEAGDLLPDMINLYFASRVHDWVEDEEGVVE